ncbi:MAG TPA: transglycosylase SLT domain-containing protein [Gemmatimonadaceae bacterium]|nr:transglycosylase SLT domain-containing protein [Gemmatimonadaceae bacterium]
MKDLRGTYVHHGDVLRRRRRVRAGAMVAGLVAAAVLGARSWEPEEAAAAGSTERVIPNDAAASALEGEHLERWNAIYTYSRRYKITTDLSAAIYDAAVAEKIDPALAFPLVRLESRFNPKALSPVGAVGLTQLMVPTARGYVPGVTREDLYDRDLNLTIGFRYLRDMIKQYKGDVQLALLVYNRGGVAVELDRELGINPSNGYDRIVMKDYKGKGVLD